MNDERNLHDEFEPPGVFAAMRAMFNKLEFDPPTHESWDALPREIQYKLLVERKWSRMAELFGQPPNDELFPGERMLWEEPRG